MNPPAPRTTLIAAFLFAIVAFFLSIAAVPASAQMPAPPSGATVVTRLEESSDWQTCGNCGNSGGTGDTATYSITRGITSPNTDGSSTKFAIGGSHAYKNAYWYIKSYDAPSTPVTYLKYEFDIYVPTQYANAPQAIEFECQQKANGHIYNFAWQADYAHHAWRTFNYVTRAWEASAVSFAGFSAGKWHHVIAEFHAEGTKVVHDALSVDGVRTVVKR